MTLWGEETWEDDEETADGSLKWMCYSMTCAHKKVQKVLDKSQQSHLLSPQWPRQ